MNPSPMILKGNAGISLEFRFVETDDGDGNVCYNLTIMRHIEGIVNKGQHRTVKNSQVMNCNLIPHEMLQKAINTLDLELIFKDNDGE